MGFSSYECNLCGKSILATYALDRYSDVPERYTESVWIPKPGATPVIGTFDGYGNVTTEDGEEVDVYKQMARKDGIFHEPMVHHKDCWENAGKPTIQFEPSERAKDQGYFIDAKVYV